MYILPTQRGNRTRANPVYTPEPPSPFRDSRFFFFAQSRSQLIKPSNFVHSSTISIQHLQLSLPLQLYRTLCCLYLWLLCLSRPRPLTKTRPTQLGETATNTAQIRNDHGELSTMFSIGQGPVGNAEELHPPPHDGGGMYGRPQHQQQSLPPPARAHFLSAGPEPLNIPDSPPKLSRRPPKKGNKRETLSDIARRVPVEVIRPYFNYPLRRAAEVSHGRAVQQGRYNMEASVCSHGRGKMLVCSLIMYSRFRPSSPAPASIILHGTAMHCILCIRSGGWGCGDICSSRFYPAVSLGVFTPPFGSSLYWFCYSRTDGQRHCSCRHCSFVQSPAFSTFADFTLIPASGVPCVLYEYICACSGLCRRVRPTQHMIRS